MMEQRLMSSGILLLNRAGDAPLATPFRSAALGENDPFGAGRDIAWTGPDAMSAGRVNLAGTYESGAFPHTEFVVVVAGHLRLAEPGKVALELSPGRGAVIARGTVVKAEAEPGTRLVFCAATGAGSAAPGLQEILAEAPLSPSAAPPAEALVGPTPQCRSFNAFTDEATRFRAGTWDSTPYRRILRPHRLNELMHVVTGSIDLTGPDGTITRVDQGDSVFVAHGAPCAWDSSVHVAKFYVVQEVAG
ncbi:putative cupin superfamily protein [Bosea psychrotolerans]|uniref:Putative cupin superfamily protein n=2 Tax=Bosea psychrotolerans TaxID=1871628 RepID=A0A2S4LV75_9HYPH|nr:putative cupin superfamily protein [Bosea psychrotolerans]